MIRIWVTKTASIVERVDLRSGNAAIATDKGTIFTRFVSGFDKS